MRPLFCDCEDGRDERRTLVLSLRSSLASAAASCVLSAPASQRRIVVRGQATDAAMLV